MNIILNEHGATKGPKPDQSILDIKILSVDLPEIQEVNTEAIAKEKAMLGAQLANGPCVVEDTSLQFTALGGMPGPYIKWFQQSLGSEGLYKILNAYEDKSATAVCTLAFCPYPHADTVLFTGTTKGQIVEPVEGRVSTTSSVKRNYYCFRIYTLLCMLNISFAILIIFKT